MLTKEEFAKRTLKILEHKINEALEETPEFLSEAEMIDAVSVKIVEWFKHLGRVL